MSIPSNFIIVEEQLLNCATGGTPVTAQFTAKPPAGVDGDQCFLWNDGSNSAQIMCGATASLATPVVDASAALLVRVETIADEMNTRFAELSARLGALENTSAQPDTSSDETGAVTEEVVTEPAETVEEVVTAPAETVEEAEQLALKRRRYRKL